MNYTDSEDEPMTPPPIVTYNVDTDDDAIKKVLRRMLKCEFSLKRQKDALYIHTHSKADYDTLIEFLQFREHGYCTYQPPWHDAQLIVLKEYLGDEGRIIADLKVKDVKCLGVHVINRRPSDSPARLLTLSGDTNLDRVRRIRYLGNIGGFSWSDYTADKYTPLQCHRCQRLRHDSRFCHMPPNCHTCGENHPSEDCTSKDPRKCFNCQGKHPAYDADCPEWIAYKEELASARKRAEKKQGPGAALRLASTVARCNPSVDTLANHMDSLWNLAEGLGVASMCFNYETTSISIDYGPIPTNGQVSSVVPARPFKIGLRRSTANK